MKLPKIKKSIKSYAMNEDGKISKQALITMGAFLGAAALTGIVNSKDAVSHGNYHTNHVTLNIIDNQANGQHTHHASY